MKRTILVLALVLTACGGPGMMTEPQCGERDVVTCDGEEAPEGNVRWTAYCTDGSAVTTRLEMDETGVRVEVTCEGECTPLARNCDPAGSLCPEGQVPLCVWPDNFCEVAPEADEC